MVQPASVIQRPKQSEWTYGGLRRSPEAKLSTPSTGLRFSGQTFEPDPEVIAEVERLKSEHTTSKIDETFPVEPETYLARARFNLTGNPEFLHEFFPYRKKLAERHSPVLQQYDALVEQILTKAEFYQVPDYKSLRVKLRPLYHGKAKRSVFYPVISAFKKSGRVLWSLSVSLEKARDYKVKWLQAIQRRSEKIDNATLKNAIDQNTTPLRDASTRYAIAASLAELLHRHPEYINNVLNPRHGRPLRFVMSNFVISNKKLMDGQTNIGINVIWINGYAMWQALQKQLPEHQFLALSIAQHEFVHVWSEAGGLTSLPIMTDQQRQRFEQDRTWLFKRFNQMGLDHAPINSASTIGISNYGFQDATEFLPVSLDTFQYNPKRLCWTVAGEDLYRLYKELFGIDPLADLQETPQGTTQGAPR